MRDLTAEASELIVYEYFKLLIAILFCSCGIVPPLCFIEGLTYEVSFL